MIDYLYIDDYINLYSEKLHKILIINPYKNTLKHGHIIDKDKFIKKMNKIFNEYHINKNFFNNMIKVIINNDYTNIDKLVIKEVLELLNYQKIQFLQEISYLQINKNKLYINYNYSYFFICYVNNNSNISLDIYDNNKINKSLIWQIIEKLNKSKIYVYGKNYLELVNLLEKKNCDYYFYSESENLILNLLINNMSSE